MIFIIKRVGTREECMPFGVNCAVPENIHTHPRSFIGNSKREGFLKAKIFKRMYETKLEFQGGWWELGRETKKENLRERGMDIFWNNTLLTQKCLNFCTPNVYIRFLCLLIMKFCMAMSSSVHCFVDFSPFGEAKGCFCFCLKKRVMSRIEH